MSIAPAPSYSSTSPADAARSARSEDYLWTLNFGPQHPATHTTLRLVLKLDGERVVDAMPEMGYLHSGFEKLGEHLTFNQYVTVTDRMNYISPMANNVAWHHAVEKLLGIELTPRRRDGHKEQDGKDGVHDVRGAGGGRKNGLSGAPGWVPVVKIGRRRPLREICHEVAAQKNPASRALRSVGITGRVIQRGGSGDESG